MKENNAEFKTALEYIKPDIICGTESWLRGKKPGKPYSKSAIQNSEIFPDNYTVFRNDRSSRGGGVFVAVQSNITAVECVDFVTDCEIDFAKVTLKGKKELYIGSFYMPKRNMKDLCELKKSLELLNGNKPKDIILCGDFNCPDIDWEHLTLKHGQNIQDKSEQQFLIDISTEFNLTQIHDKPTREDNLLDLVFTTNSSLIKSTTNAPGISDHDMVITDSDIKPNYSFSKPRKIYKFAKANWDEIKKICNQISLSVMQQTKSGENVETLWTYFKEKLLAAIDSHVPSKMSRSSLPWLNRNIRKQLKKKHRLYKKAKASGKWEKYRHFSREVKRNLRKAEWDHVNNVIQEGLNQNNTKPFWSYTKSKRQDNIGIAPLKSKGNLLTDAKSKANILLKQFISVFTKSTDNINPEVGKFNNTPPISQIIIDNNGVLKLLKRLDVHKAMGPDGIPNIVLKNCADEISQGLCTIFQQSLSTGTLPSDWRNANITPVFKKGDRHSAENYRPVSLTSVPCKLLEHIICSHMLKHFEKYSILTTLNHGFRSGYSTETQLLVTMHDLLQATDARVQVDIAILDFSKAFDTVPHDKLLHKLDAYGIKGSLHKWLSSFLQERHMNVVVEGEHSESAPVESGVPQGTVLGPLMFLCHINDLPDTVKSQVRLFAEDCLLYRQIKSQTDHSILQNDLIELEKWAAKWGMRFNAKKCYILSIRQKSSRFYQLDGEILQEVNSSPYLGITISNDLQWKTHITNIVKKANSTLGFLRRNLKYCPEECKRLSYIALVRSTLEYGAIVWDPYKLQDIQSIEKIQRQAA